MRDADGLRMSAALGAAYLAARQGPSGAFKYSQDPTGYGRVRSQGYNLLRHAGTTWALFNAAEALEDGLLDGVARAGLRYLLGHVQRRDNGLVMPDPGTGRAKLGALGLTLLACSGVVPEHADMALGLSRAIIALQQPSGEYLSYAPDGTAASRKGSLYYPGEAMLGLMKYAAAAQDAHALTSATRGITYLCEAQRSLVDTGQIRTFPPDAWFIQAIEAGINHAPDDRTRWMWANHAAELAEGILEGFVWDDAPPVLCGMYLPLPGGSCRTAARGEGLLAAIRLMRALGGTVRPHWVHALELSDAYLLAHVYADGEGQGGLAMHAGDPAIRIDTVQHAISFWLGLADLRETS